MYAIVSTGGKQYKVAKGDIIDVEKIDAQPGEKVDLDVLMLNDGTHTVSDAAVLEGKKVSCEIVDQFKGEKIVVFKLKKRKVKRISQGFQKRQQRRMRRKQQSKQRRTSRRMKSGTMAT